MHDPMVVAHEIPSPIPHRVRWKDHRAAGRRWGFVRCRRTNAENLGEPVYRWWRPKGWTLFLAGRAYGLGTLATIWHVEPGGRDSGEVCKHWADGAPVNRWKWHVHHWSIRVPWWHHRLRRFVFERCGKCGHRFPWGYSPVSYQWEAPKPPHWWSIDRSAYHHECSSVSSLKQSIDQRDEAIRHLFAALRVATDESAEELADRLTGHTSPLPFAVRYPLTRILGFDRDDNYDLVTTTSPGKPS